MDMPENCRTLIKESIAKAKENPPHKDLTFYLLMSQNCDGKCSYCYQPKQFRQNINLTKEVIDDAMNFAIDTYGENNIKFCLFGGEPMMNWDMIKYLLDSYPTLRFQMMTNGIKLYEDENIRNFLKQHCYHLNISISIEPLMRHIGEGFLEKSQTCLDLLKTCNGDVHMVSVSPNKEDWFYDMHKYFIDYGVPKVRVSIVRQSDEIIKQRDNFITLFKKLADFLYFDRPEPLFSRSSLDLAFNINIFRKLIGKEIHPLPPTMCGCGFVYMAVDYKGDLYPCDWFANYPEFKIGDIYHGLNDVYRLFYETNHWIEGLYEDCRDCPVSDDIRLCPRAMCLAENYQNNGNPFKPTKLHCEVNKIEYEVYTYISKRAIELGWDKKYKLGSIRL